MIAITIFPTPFEVNATFHWVVTLLIVCAGLSVFCILVAILLDNYEERRQEKLQALTNQQLAERRSRELEEQKVLRRLLVDARETQRRIHLRQRERDEDAYYEAALKAASKPGPWPPARPHEVLLGETSGPDSPPRRVQ